MFGMLHHVGFLPLVVVNCAKSMEQGRHLKEQDKRDNSYSDEVMFYYRGAAQGHIPVKESTTFVIDMASSISSNNILFTSCCLNGQISVSL